MSEFIDAVRSGDVAKVDALLDATPGLIDVRLPDCTTPVQAATYSFQFDMARHLVDRGAKLDLASACCVGDLKLIEELADPETVNELSCDGFPPLGLAAAFGGVESVRLLLSAGADVNLKSTSLGGIAALHASVFGNQDESLKLLLEHGADPNLAQDAGFTALMGSAQNGNRDAIERLLKHGADPNLTTPDGQTAADYARGAGHEDLAALLERKSL